MAAIVSAAPINPGFKKNEPKETIFEDIFKSPEKVILQPYNHILQCGGKKIRTKLIEAFNFWIKADDKHIDMLRKSIESLHNASLLMDDIEDNSTLRRGLPAAHILYGVPLTMCSANYTLYKTLIEMIDLIPDENKYEGSMIISQQLLYLHQGQGLDIHWRDTQTCPTVEEYLDMIDKKTTGLFGLSVRLMQLFTKSKKDFLPLIKLIGKYFQIRDDYANLKFDEYASQKSFAEDLTEGKFSFPIVHAVSTYPEDHTILSILRLKTENETIKRFAVNYLEKLGSMEHTANVLKKLKKEIFMNINRLPHNPYLVDVMNLLYLDESENNEDESLKSQQPIKTQTNLQPFTKEQKQTKINTPSPVVKTQSSDKKLNSFENVLDSESNNKQQIEDKTNKDLSNKNPNVKSFRFFFPILP